MFVRIWRFITVEQSKVRSYSPLKISIHKHKLSELDSDSLHVPLVGVGLLLDILVFRLFPILTLSCCNSLAHRIIVRINEIMYMKVLCKL